MNALFSTIPLARLAGVSLITVAFASAVTIILQGKLLNSRASEINALADLATQTFQSTLNEHVETAYGVRSFLSHTDGATTRDEFHRYIGSLDVPRRMPGLLSIMAVKIVPGSEKDRFLASMHQDTSLDLVNVSQFVIWPKAEKALYLPVMFAEPANMSNVRGALGFDNGSEPIRLTAFEQSVRTDSPVITQPVTSAVSKVQALLLYLPFFDHRKPTTTPTEREKAALGAVVIAFRSEKLFNSAFNLFLQHNPDLLVQVFDGAVPDPAKLIYNSEAGKKVLGATFPSERITVTRTIELVGRTWTLEFSDFATNKNASRLPMLIMIGFLVLISAIGGALLMKRPRQTNKA